MPGGTGAAARAESCSVSGFVCPSSDLPVRWPGSWLVVLMLFKYLLACVMSSFAEALLLEMFHKDI